MLLTARTRSHRRHVRPGRKNLDRIDGEEGQLSKNSCRKPFVDIYRQAKHDTFLCRVCKLQSSIKGAAVATCTKQMMNSSWPSMGRGISQRRHNEPLEFENLRALTSSDASFTGESGSQSQPCRVYSWHHLGDCVRAPPRSEDPEQLARFDTPPPPWSSQTAEVWRSLHCGTDRAQCSVTLDLCRRQGPYADRVDTATQAQIISQRA